MVEPPLATFLWIPKKNAWNSGSHRKRRGFRAGGQRKLELPVQPPGGDLGTFGPGQMVPEFDQVVFSAPVGVVQGPVKTQFGYHLVEVTERQD